MSKGDVVNRLCRFTLIHMRSDTSLEFQRSFSNSHTVSAIFTSAASLNCFLFDHTGLVTEVLTDAQQYSKHAGKTELDKDDVRLAVRSMASFGGTQPPPKDVRR